MCQRLGPGSRDPHGTGELTNIDLIIQTIDAAVLLVQSDKQWDLMARIAGYSLQFEDQARGFLGG